MQLWILGTFALALTLDLVPAVVLVTRILVRARLAGVPAGRHAGVALVGGLMAGLAANTMIVQYFLFRMSNGEPVSTRLQTPVAYLSGFCASGLAAGVVYLHLRMTTQHDPDYEEPHV